MTWKYDNRIEGVKLARKELRKIFPPERRRSLRIRDKV